MLSLLLLALSPWWQSPPVAPGTQQARGVPYAFTRAGDCTQHKQTVACFQDQRLRLLARPHSDPVPESAPRVWLRVSGLEWQAFHAQPIGEADLGGQRVPVHRLGHPHAPHAGWELARIDEDTGPQGERVKAVSLEHAVGLVQPKLAGQAALGCPLVPLEDAPIALLYDDSGALRMLRLQGLPPAGLGALDDLACVAEALSGAKVKPGVKVVEAALTLR